MASETAARPETYPATNGHRRPVLRAIGNVLLGMAVGLLAYYALTDFTARRDQSQLRETAPSGIGSPQAPAVVSGSDWDFDGWAQEDGAYWRKLGNGKVFARIVIGRMKLDTMVVKGVRRADLARGPGWIPGTDLPGSTGNVGVSGHRTTYAHPFLDIDRLKRGDTIDLYSPWRRYRYEVAATRVVRPWQSEVIASTQTPQLTLTACHPKYSAKYRYIVSARLVSVTRLKAATERTTP